MPPLLDGPDRRFADAAIRRERLFLWLSAAGVAVGLILASYYGWRRWHDPGYPLQLRAALVVLILLNARQNLRQYRYARVLRRLRHLHGVVPCRDDVLPHERE